MQTKLSLNNETSLLIYIFIHMFDMAGQTAGPNWLHFFERTRGHGYPKGNIGSEKLTFLKFHGQWFNTKIVEYKPVLTVSKLNVVFLPFTFVLGQV